MLHCGLLGEKLGHSYSPAIHAMLGEYEYRFFEKSPQELPGFLRSGSFDGINVTIPYKKTVVPYCTELSQRARALGSVNTIVRREDGTLYGDNTDYFGFECMIRVSGIDVRGKKALVLGSGGASVTACAVLKALGASEVVVISRTGENNYQNLHLHADAGIIANTTPLGMYPKNGEAALDLRRFPNCTGVLDVVFNPARTALLLQAEELNIPNAGGLYMLVAQAKLSSEQFQKRMIDDSEIDRIYNALASTMQNIVLIGMPGSGKSAVAKALAEATGREVLEADAVLSEKAGTDIPTIFATEGNDGFRLRETEILRELGKHSGCILSTGGGCITREENYPLLHQNGTIFWLQRSIDVLPTEGRPLSQQNDLNEMYRVRKPLYARFADHVINNDGTMEQTVQQILKIMK